MNRFFFRVIEQEDGSWECRLGQEDFDWFDQLDEAIEHTTGFARENAPSEIVVHHLDGRVQSIATFD